MRQVNTIGIGLLAISIFSICCGRNKPTSHTDGNRFIETIEGAESLAVFGKIGWLFSSDTLAYGQVFLVGPSGMLSEGSVVINGVLASLSIGGYFEPPPKLPYCDTLNIEASYREKQFKARLRNVPLLRNFSPVDTVVEISVGEPLFVSWNSEKVDSVNLIVQGYVSISDGDNGSISVPGFVFNRAGESQVILERCFYKLIRAGFCPIGFEDSTFILNLAVSNFLFVLRVNSGK